MSLHADCPPITHKIPGFAEMVTKIDKALQQLLAHIIP